MTTIPKLTVRYAWQTPYGSGPTWESIEEAREDTDMVDSGAVLLKLFIHPDGRILHTEQVDA